MGRKEAKMGVIEAPGGHPGVFCAWRQQHMFQKCRTKHSVLAELTCQAPLVAILVAGRSVQPSNPRPHPVRFNTRGGIQKSGYQTSHQIGHLGSRREVGPVHQGRCARRNLVEQPSNMIGVEIAEQACWDVAGNQSVRPWDVADGNSQGRENGVYCCVYGKILSADIGEEITCKRCRVGVAHCKKPMNESFPVIDRIGGPQRICRTQSLSQESVQIEHDAGESGRKLHGERGPGHGDENEHREMGVTFGPGKAVRGFPP